MATALARPAVTVMGQGARKVVVVMDTSASMKARDAGGTRFAAARAQAASLVSSLGEGAEVMVIESGVQPRVLAPLSRDRERAASAIRSTRPRDLPHRLTDALRTARALVGADPRAEIYVFTDGAFTLAAGPESQDARIHWMTVGRGGRNVGITNLAVRKNYYGSFEYQAFASLVNYTGEMQTFTFTLAVDGNAIADKTVTLEPNVRRSLLLPFSHTGGGVVKASIDVRDDLATDNTAWAVLPPPRKIAVMLVSPGNLFLEKVLRTDPQVALDVRTPDQYQGGMGEADVVVLDSVTLPRVGQGRCVFVNAVPADVPLETLGRIERPTIMDWDRSHPVMRHVEFAKVNIEDALRIRPLAAGRPLVEAVGGPLIYALEEPDRKALFVGFDLFKTDFPLRVAFPLILSNGLRWLHPAGLDQASLQLTAGQPILLPVEHGVTSVSVNTPGGRTVKAQVTRGVVSFTETDEVGVYTLSTAKGETKIAVNLADADESDITPRPLPTAAARATEAVTPVAVQRELWQLFVVIALALLVIEGLLYWRRQSGGHLALPSSLGDRWALALRSALVVVLALTLLKPTVPRWVDGLDVVAESLVLPQEVKYGEPFQARVVAWSLKDTQGRLSLFRNGEFLGSQVVRLQAGKNVFSYRQALDASGIHVYQASLEVDGDTIEDNNRAVGSVVVRGRPQVLLAEKDRSHAQSLASALRSQNIEVTVVDAGGVPKDIVGLQKYDGVILSNVSSLKLTRAQMTMIRDYVRDQGGGLIMVGGEESFGLGGYYRTPIEEALPVTMEVKQKVEIPSLAVVLSIDRSGSMAMSTGDEKVTKLDLAKEASHLVVDLLDDRNEVGVMSWDTEFIWDVAMRSARDKAAIHHAIATIKAGGGTDGYPALKESYAVLFERPALLKHVIFLSDGQMTRGDFAGLLRRMAKDKITVSTVAIGKDADLQLMVDIAKWGRGRFYYTEDSQTIPRIFTLETQLASKASLIEQPFKPQLTSASHEAMQDIDWKAVPPLGGYVATTLKQAAELVLMSHQEDPVLATWRYGLGRSAAFTSDAKAKWGVLWLRWREFNRFWAQLIRWTLRSGSRSDTVAFVERRENMGEIVVDAVDPKGEFINFLDSQVGVVAPNRERTVIDLEQVGPGRYRGRFPAAQEGVYLVGMAQRRGDRVIGSQLAGLVVPYAQELRDLGVGQALLRELAELTGGSALASPRDAFLTGRRRSRITVEVWPWLVARVAFLLIPGVAMRRLGAWAWQRIIPARWRRDPERGQNDA